MVAADAAGATANEIATADVAVAAATSADAHRRRSPGVGLGPEARAGLMLLSFESRDRAGGLL